MRIPFLLAASTFLAISLHAQLPAITADPAADKANPPSMDAFQIPSHDGKMNALFYFAAGAGPHHTVVLLHGFPGNEKNLDLAQAIRRAGWNVLYFDYRGSWGAPGSFSFSNAMEDTKVAIAYLRDPANATRLHVDTKNIVLMGHSMGGMISVIVGERDPQLRGIGLISAANMAGRTQSFPKLSTTEGQAALQAYAGHLEEEGVYPLAGCTAQSLATELIDNGAKWDIPGQAAQMTAHTILVVSSDDGLAPDTDKFVSIYRGSGGKHITTVHLATDHAYSGQRIALETAVLNWLATL